MENIDITTKYVITKEEERRNAQYYKDHPLASGTPTMRRTDQAGGNQHGFFAAATAQNAIVAYVKPEAPTCSLM